MVLIFFLGCANSSFQLRSIKLKNRISSSKKTSHFYGDGQISSNLGKYKNLKFTFTSQNDTSLIFLKDIFGRSVIMMGFENDEVLILDILRNKLYDFDQIKYIYPTLNGLKPKTINEFICNQDMKKNINDNIHINNNEMTFRLNSKVDFLLNNLNFKSDSLVINVNIVDRSIKDHKVNIKKKWMNFKK